MTKTIEEIRAMFPQYAEVSDGDLLIGLHRAYYPNMHPHEFFASIRGAENAHATISKGPLRDYWTEKVSAPMDGESETDRGLRTGGALVADASSGGRLGTAARSGLQGMTFGGGDEVVAAGTSALSGNTYDYELLRERTRLDKGREEYPATALASEIGGAVAVPIGALGQGGKLLPRIGAGALQGGLLSGVYGFLSGEGGAASRANSAFDAAKLGAFVGGAIPAIGAGVRRIQDAAASRRAIMEGAKGAPTTEQLRAAGRQAYDAIDNAGVQIKPEAFNAARLNILDDLRTNTGFDELPGPGSLTPKAARTMQIMDDAGSIMAQEPTAALPFASLDKMRRQAGAAAGDMANRTDSAAGTAIIGGLDDFVNRLGPDDVVAGDAEALKTLIPKARELWGRMSRSQTIDDAIEASQDYLSGSASGIRNQFRRILRSDKLSRGFTEAEKAAMRRVINGSPLERILHLAGGGLGNLSALGGGFAAGGVPGLLAGAGAASGLRKASEAVALRNAEVVRGLVANGGLQALPKASPAFSGLLEAAMQKALAASAPQVSGLLSGR